MYIVADIGGTKTRIAGSMDLETFGEPIVIGTPLVYADAIATIAETVQKVAAGAKIDGMAIGITGVQSRDKRTIVKMRHADWVGKPLADDVEKALNTHVYIENDVVLVGLGEAIHGAGVGAPVFVYITVSTGINGVRVVDGVIGNTRFNAEIGGQYLQIGDRSLTIEDLVSGHAIEEKYGMPPKELGKDSPIWEDLALTFAYALHNTILHWSPDRIALGGSMFNEIGIPVESVRSHVVAIMKKFPEVPEIVHASLGDFGGLHGGLVRLKRFTA